MFVGDAKSVAKPAGVFLKNVKTAGVSVGNVKTAGVFLRNA